MGDFQSGYRISEYNIHISTIKTVKSQPEQLPMEKKNEDDIAELYDQIYAKKPWIRIGMSDIKINGPTEDNRVEVRFKQDYKSSNFSANSDKLLVLENYGTGWKIVNERGY